MDRFLIFPKKPKRTFLLDKIGHADRLDKIGHADRVLDFFIQAGIVFRAAGWRTRRVLDVKRPFMTLLDHFWLT
jgi:hypothetical protein